MMITADFFGMLVGFVLMGIGFYLEYNEHYRAPFEVEFLYVGFGATLVILADQLLFPAYLGYVLAMFVGLGAFGHMHFNSEAVETAVR